MISDIGGFSEMQGATDTEDGATGFVPKPKAGDNTKFLQGDGKWVAINQFTPMHANQLIQLRSDVNIILGDDRGSSMREVAASEVAKVIANAPADLNNLEKIADKLVAQDSQLISLNDRIEMVEQAIVGDLAEELEALRQKDNYLQLAIDDLDFRLQWKGLVEEG